MSEDHSTTPSDTEVKQIPVIDGNRKQRRFEKALSRKDPKQYRSVNHWRNRIVREMIQNKQVQQKIIDGEFDYFLENGDLLEEKKDSPSNE